MKKAGIITFHNAENYGAALQTYALMKIIQDFGCDCQIINYHNRGVFMRNLIKNVYYLFTCQSPLKNHRAYQYFQDKYLKLTAQTYRNVSEFEKDADDFDYLIFGSDQIWNPDLSNGFDPFYFGQFSADAKKIAYGASFGKDEASAQELQKLNHLITPFDAVAVREETLLPLIKREAECVVDPCMLLSNKDWNKISLDNVPEKNYILIYQLHQNKRLIQTALKLAEDSSKEILLISPYFSLHPRNNIHKPGRITPNAFLAYYDHADIVISDSFHGTIFSILYQKPFYTILPSAKTKRITSLLHKLGLSNRIVSKHDLSPLAIDYGSVNPLLEHEINTSLDYLRRNLS